jgi:hypothetical protein
MRRESHVIAQGEILASALLSGAAMQSLRTLFIALTLAGGLCACATGVGPTGERVSVDEAISPDGDEGIGPARGDARELTGAEAATATGEFVEAEPGYHPEPIYAVVLVESDDVLNVRAEPGVDGAIVDTLPPESVEITGTGRESVIGESRWVEILMPYSSTSGWVNARYLTEFVSAERFCDDTRVRDLIAELSRAIRTNDGERLFALTSPKHGVTVNMMPGDGVHYSDVEVRSVFFSEFEQDWGIHPYSGLPVSGSFKDVVLPELTSLFTSDAKTDVCNRLVMGSLPWDASWPSEYANFNFYSLHIPGSPEYDGMDWKTWVVGVEMVEGQPYIVALYRFAR